MTRVSKRKTTQSGDEFGDFGWSPIEIDNTVDLTLIGEEISLEALCEHCKAEAHDYRSTHRRIGF